MSDFTKKCLEKSSAFPALVVLHNLNHLSFWLSHWGGGPFLLCSPGFPEQRYVCFPSIRFIANPINDLTRGDQLTLDTTDYISGAFYGLIH